MHLKMWSMQALSGPVLAAVGERYYKVTAEALRVCGELVKAIRPNFDMVRDYFLTYGHVMCCFMVGHLCNCFSQLDIL
jgi:cullin-associated NEDD8-dissociated protein 1